jgi:hypothetical protein
MVRLIDRIITVLYAIAALLLVVFALLAIGWSVWEVFDRFRFNDNMVKRLLQAVGAIVISIAIIDVAKYLFEEEIFRSKELRSPIEARKTLTKIFVIISIAVSLEGLVFIFKAGTTDMKLIIYPAVLVITSILAMVGLGMYQKLSVKTENETNMDM